MTTMQSFNGLAGACCKVFGFTAAVALMTLFAVPAKAEGRGHAAVLNQIECLALAIYFEARGEPEAGQRAVAHVVMNRVDDADFPNSVCDVVQDGGQEVLHRCQFSWWCDGNSTEPRDVAAWERSMVMARTVYWNYSDDPTLGALWFHANYVDPSWNQVFTRGPKIGMHIFYTRPGDDTPASGSPQLAQTP